MAPVVPEADTEFGARVARRLREDHLAWFTAVDRVGTPQPSPVWFVWNEASSTALVYSRADAKRLDHIRAHPQIALHLDGDGQGGDIVVLTGEAEIDPDEPPAHKNAPYIAKYGELIRSGWPTAEEFASIYSVPIRIRARRVRGH
ncbi:MAG: TIGR03667 family PPOX class F420-dependent oxidoreductase [Geodermatophilaceae bacterium]|nr:TIGR03667 family PPOX class F420-dependent oxidoreductase [Geodermatophilaceae bacterium]